MISATSSTKKNEVLNLLINDSNSFELDELFFKCEGKVFLPWDLSILPSWEEKVYPDDRFGRPGFRTNQFTHKASGLKIRCHTYGSDNSRWSIID